MGARGLIDAIHRDTQRSWFRTRNGIKYASGLARPRVGLSPKEVVWSRGKAQLWRYESDRRVRRRPLIIVCSVMGRSYVMDLRPGNSFVERLLATGTDVFLLDFGVPDAVDANNTLETYVDHYLPRAIRAALDASGADEVDVLGYCFGGLLSTLAVAGHADLPVAGLAVMATPVDFSLLGSYSAFRALTRGGLEIDDVVDHTGNIPAERVRRMFWMLKPTSDISTYASLWERLWDDSFVDGFRAMGQWAGDQVPMPGGLARQGLELLLRRNVMMTGELPVGGRRIALADIRVPVLNIVAERDHIVPPAAARPLNDLVSSRDVNEVVVPAGHIGLVTSRQSVRHTIPELIAWLDRH